MGRPSGGCRSHGACGRMVDGGADLAELAKVIAACAPASVSAAGARFVRLPALLQGLELRHMLSLKMRCQPWDGGVYEYAYVQHPRYLGGTLPLRSSG